MNEDVSSQVADHGSLGLAPEIVNRRTTVKALKGDTVALIAKRYNVSAMNVADWNKVTVHAGFKPGQAVVLYVPVKAASAAKASSRKPSARKGPPSASAHKKATRQAR